MSKNFPKIGYIVHWPSRRIVRVKVSKTVNPNFPLYVESLEPTVNIGESACNIGESVGLCNAEPVIGNGFYIADLSTLLLYRSRKQAEKLELEKIYKEYAFVRGKLRLAQRKYKWALKAVAEYRRFKQLHAPHFVQ